MATGIEGNDEPADQWSSQDKATQKELRQVKKKLQRKESALAETAALLVLRKKAKAIWGISDEDQRPLAKRSAPKHKLKPEEKALILKTINQPEHASKPPSQIVPIRADKVEYIASESSFYRVMRDAGEQNYRGRALRPESRPLSSFCATAKNQVWSWDITYLNGPVRGLYYYLYLILDIFTRDIVGWEVWEEYTDMVKEFLADPARNDD